MEATVKVFDHHDDVAIDGNHGHDNRFSQKNY